MATEKRYELTPASTQLLERAFLRQPPKDDQASRYELINSKLEHLARTFCTLTPQCPEQTIMVNKIREVAHWAKEAIEKNEIGGR